MKRPVRAIELYALGANVYTIWYITYSSTNFHKKLRRITQFPWKIDAAWRTDALEIKTSKKDN